VYNTDKYLKNHNLLSREKGMKILTATDRNAPDRLILECARIIKTNFRNIIIMRIENKLDVSFGPFGSSTGLFLLILGLISTYYTLFGLVLAIAGAFTAFTHTITIIDTDNNKIRYCEYLFGFIPFGKWIEIKPDMKLGLRNVKRGYLGYIKGTQPFNIQYKDIRIYLYNSGNKKIIPVKKFDSIDSAAKELKSLAAMLGLTII
jgi:hypothetical protein